MKVMVEENSLADFDASPEVRKRTSYTNLRTHYQPDFEKDRLVVFTDTRFNMFQLARNHAWIYEKYIDILKHDFILINHHKGYSVFLRRPLYAPHKTTQFADLRKFKNVFYTVQPPPVRKRSHSLPNRMLVFFSHMHGDGYHKHAAIERMFVRYFADIQRSLVKNVYVVRLADVNLSHGSYFSNTANFPDYELQIQELLQNLATRYDVDKKDIILHGGSKGGTGALLHGCIGDYNVIAGDPIIDSAFYNKRDIHFVKHFKPENMTEILLQHAQNNTQKKFIFASRVELFNFRVSQNLVDQCGHLMRLVDLSDDQTVKTHPNITSHSVPEQIALMNLLFDGVKVLGHGIGKV